MPLGDGLPSPSLFPPKEPKRPRFPPYGLLLCPLGRDLQQSLDKFSVPEAERVEIKAIVASTRVEQFEAVLKTAFPQARLSLRRARLMSDLTRLLEKSFDAAGQGAAALNRKIIEIAQRNLNSGFDLARSLAGAKNLAEIVELQAAYWQKQMDALTAQAEFAFCGRTYAGLKCRSRYVSEWGEPSCCAHVVRHNCVKCTPQRFAVHHARNTDGNDPCQSRQAS
jgi:hypothetical protein